MKSEYAEYYRPSDAEFEALWKDSIIAFDASALLNLYFYSEPTAQTVLAVMGLLKDRVWLPHQAGLEYQRNRLGVLAKVAKGYSEAKKTLLSIRSQIHARSQPPFLEDELVKRYDPISDEIIAAFEKAIAAEDARSDNDSVRDQLDALFSARVGKGFTDKELATIYSEGRERYKAKIPPGYKDEKEKSGNDAFGDLVIWKELIEKCKADKKSAILVTDDGKEDWWLIHDDRTIGPRPELLREFQLSAGQPCYLYSSESFLRYAAQSLNASVAPAAIQEVKEVLGPPSVVFRADFNGFESAWESAKVSRKVEGGVSAISRLTELLKSRMHCFSDKERDILLSATYDADVLANTALQPLKSDVFRCGYSNC
ncbi:MAG TPA: PIN-like domain-containing protein, partial [Planctomycetaceae bacterium]|nr:PIN-like domain-containing protein [Planctomycetaceae bacterium]